MKILTPVKSIRKKCLECSGGMKGEVRLCPVLDCPLYPYRMGRAPNRGRGKPVVGRGVTATQGKI